MNAINKSLNGDSNTFNFKETKFKYTVLSVDHFKELQSDLEKLFLDENLSSHKNFRRYLEAMSFNLPEKFQHAKYVVLLVRQTYLGLIDINFKGTKQQVMISPGYFGYTKYNPDEIADYVN